MRLFQIAQHADHLAGALAGDVLERAGGVDFGRLRIEQIAHLGLEPLLAQRPGHLLDALRAGEDVRGRGLGRLHHRVELLARLAEFAVIIGVRLHRRDLGLGARDRLRHLDEIEADAVDRFDRALDRCIAASMRSSALSSIVVSAVRLRRAYSARNQRPRAVSITALSIAS